MICRRRGRRRRQKRRRPVIQASRRRSSRRLKRWRPSASIAPTPTRRWLRHPLSRRVPVPQTFFRPSRPWRRRWRPPRMLLRRLAPVRPRRSPTPSLTWRWCRLPSTATRCRRSRLRWRNFRRRLSRWSLPPKTTRPAPRGAPATESMARKKLSLKSSATWRQRNRVGWLPQSRRCRSSTTRRWLRSRRLRLTWAARTRQRLPRRCQSRHMTISTALSCRWRWQ